MAVNFKFNCESNFHNFCELTSLNKGKKNACIELKTRILGNDESFYFDIPTAIKFAKTLRTEINKAKEGGQDNG